MKSTREDPFIKLFLSAYENSSWADAELTKPDANDRKNKAVDQIATRSSDQKTLAIEHTIIEPFVGEIEDFDSFKKWFLEIEKDDSLLVPGRSIRVNVPAGVLQKQPKESRDAIVKSVHDWIKINRRILPDGISEQPCSIKEISGKPQYEITLNLKIVPLQGGPLVELGSVQVRRQQISDSLGEVIEKALKDKLPKLVSTAADKHLLLLERQHMPLDPEDILREIENRRASFPDLAGVDEIWILDVIGFEIDFGGTCVAFSLYEEDHVVRSFNFYDGNLIAKSEDGVAEVIRRV